MATKNRYLSIFEAIPLPAVVLRTNSPEFTVENANEAYSKISGKSIEELIGANLFELFPDNPTDSTSNNATEETALLDDVIETGRENSKNIQRYDLEIDDSEVFEDRYYKQSHTPIFNDDGKIEYILQVVEEVTDKIHREREHNLLFNESEASFVLVGLDMNIVNFNREFELLYESLTGKTPKKDQSVLDFAQPGRQEKVSQLFERALSGEVTNDELTFPGENGLTRHFKVKYKPAVDSKGNIYGAVVSQKETTTEREAIQKLRESEARFRALVEKGHDVLFVFSLDGTPTYISPTIENVLGYTSEEAKNMDLFSTIHPDDFPHVQSELDKCLKRPGVPIEVTPARMKHKDGSWRWFGGTITNMLHDPAINGIVDNFREITWRVEMEQKLELARKKYKSLVQSNDGLFWEAKADTFEFTYVSPQVKEMLGYTPKEWLDEPEFWENKIHPEDRENAVNYCQRETTKGKNHEFEYRFKKADGSYMWLKDVVTVIKKDEKPVLLRGLMLDITDRKVSEKNRLAEQEKYQSIFENSLAAFMVTRPDGSILEANRAACKLFGYSVDEIRELGRHGLIDPESPELNDRLRERMETGSTTGELIGIHKSGKKIPCEFSSVLFKDINGDPLSTVMMVDITDRKYYHKSLLLSNMQLKERIREQKCIYAISQLDEQKLSVESLLKEAVDIIPSGFQHPEIAQVSITWKEQLYQTEQYSLSARQLKVKSRRFKEWPFVIVVSYGDDKPEAGHSSFLDEERKLLASIKDQLAIKIEKILQKKELEQRNAYIDATINNLPIGVGTHDLKSGIITFSNSKLEEIYGWPKDSFQTIEDFFENVYPDEEYRKHIKQRVLNDIASGDPERMQWNGIEITTRDGRKKIVNAKNIPLFEQDLMISTVVDVTAEKESEKERIRLLESISDAYFALNSSWQFTYVNKEAERVLNRRSSEMVGQNMWEVFADLKETEIHKIYQNVFESQIPTSTEFFYKPLNTWFDISIYPNNGGLSVFFRDINEKIERETRLRDLSLVASKTTDSVIITDAEERITWVNDAFTKLSGYSLDECKGQVPGDFLQGPKTNSGAKRRLKKGIEKKVSVDEVILNYSKDGKSYWLEINIDPIFNENGECTHFIAIQRNVTEKVEREEKLRKTVERYDTVSKATSDTIWDFDLSEDKMHYNNNIYTMFGYKFEEVSHLASWWRSKIHPNDQLYISQELRNAISFGKDRFQMEYRFRCADGSYKHIYDRAFLIKGENGDPVRMIGAMQDITKMVEEQEQMKLLQSVITNTNESVVITEAETMDQSGGKIVYVNDAFTSMTGYSEEEVLGQTTDFLLGPKSDPELCNQLRSSLGSQKASEIEFINYKKCGEEFWVHTSGVPVENRDGVCSCWVFISRDITDQKEQEEKILSSLKEKETLLAEIHHRVKNNLAVVSSLMELQVMYSNDNELQGQLMSSVMRIKSMATIHEQLYQSNSFSKLQFSDGLKRLVNSVVGTLQSDVEIMLTYDLDDVELSINQGIPCSLLVNEIITNILKHSYKGRASGNINICLRDSGEAIHLEIEDDGNGLPDGFEEMDTTSMGIQLIDLLTQQLKGEKRYRSDRTGTTFSLRFTKYGGKGAGSTFVN
ncbi:PAS domain S-box protein [Rhodohalobacter sp. 8-1]|uniref:PAS domain S-box protein n=1 Tax=Rhodohalobacter sp. 8-1 TaxID=3131972 RepID=UPI0030EE0A25